jgi:hypothetical protein
VTAPPASSPERAAWSIGKGLARCVFGRDDDLDEMGRVIEQCL